MALTLKVLAVGVLGDTGDTGIYPPGAATQSKKTALVSNIILANHGTSSVNVELTVRKQNTVLAPGSLDRGAFVFKKSIAAGAVEAVTTEISLFLDSGPDAIYLRGNTDIEYVVNGLERDV